MGLFVTFEGGEGCGKSTQAGVLCQKLRQQNVPAIVTHDPGGTALGSEIAESLKWKPEILISPQAELLLFAASHAQLVREVIRPALAEGKTVICDRFTHSTLAYQGYGRGLRLNMIETLNSLATQDLKPDIIILLDLPAEEGLSRKRTRKDSFESEELSFHHRVREGYLTMAAAEPERWLTIDAMLPEPRVADAVWEKVRQLLEPGC